MAENRCVTPLSRIYSCRYALFSLLSASVPVAALEPDARRPVTGMEPEEVITILAPLSSPLIITESMHNARQPIPAADGADYLKSIAGFSQLRNGGTNGDPVFRGMFGSRLRILADDGEMPGACGGRMDAPTAYLSPESFDSVQLIKGPQTVLWGPGAPAGTVRFERHRPAFDQPGMRLRASMMAGSAGRWDNKLDGMLGNQDGYMRLLGTTGRAGDYQDGAGQRVASRWQKWSGDLSAGWTPDAHSLLEISVGRGNGEASYAGRALDGSRFLRESLMIKGEKSAIGPVLDTLEFSAWDNRADHVMDNYRRPHQLRPVRGRVARHTSGGRTMATWLWPAIQLQAGMDGQYSMHGKYPAGQWQPDARIWQSGAFAELQWQAAAGRTLTGGARVDWVAADDLRQPGGPRRQSFLPAGFVRWQQQQAAMPVLWYAGIGYTERFPDYWELLAPRSGYTAGNPAFWRLQPEKTLQLDIGSQYQQGPVTLWASAFAAQIRDYIVFRYQRTPVVSSYADNIAASLLGGEAGLALTLWPEWKLESSLAWARGENHSQQRPLPQIAPLEGRLALTWQHETWSVTGLWRLVAAQKRIARDEGSVAGKDFAPSAGFAVLSANFAWQASRDVQLAAGIDNLLDRRYAEHLNLAGNSNFGYPADRAINEPGRTLWARLAVDF